MEDFEDSEDLSALFADMDQIEANRKLSSKVGFVQACPLAAHCLKAACQRDLGGFSRLKLARHDKCAHAICRQSQRAIPYVKHTISSLAQQYQSCNVLATVHKVTDLP